MIGGELDEPALKPDGYLAVHVLLVGGSLFVEDWCSGSWAEMGDEELLWWIDCLGSERALPCAV
jgi:hypothetical protein